MPCHFGTYIVGTISDIKGEPITGALGKLYGREFFSKTGGCISIAASDGHPFTLAFSAPGYIPVEGPTKPGYYKIRAKLAPVGSSSSGEIVWEEISEREYHVVNKQCS
jgi:hypothetical protein